MKIAMLFPVSAEPELEAVVKDQVESCASPGTEIVIFSDENKTIAYAGEIETRSVGAIEHASYAEKNGFDAVIIGAMCDFGLMAARGAVNIPVVGMASATYHLASQLSRKFACISVSKYFTPGFLRSLRESGCYDKMTSMRDMPKPLKLPLPEDYYAQEEFEEQVKKIAREQIEKEGAQLLVVVCGMLTLLLPPGGMKRLSEELGVIVLDPMETVVKTAEMFVNLRVSHSKIEYPQIEF